ncbi:hypothetical protein RM844_27975 [Streptomyces sp. DSM 44915]|uniref:Carbon monoxide dehydrogenase subunit G n=1 Tax=Streptomyces chisholmiae TaxID=3075540 RepID=A0ABU2JZD5_9ACTN|nr:hypothetical protein [Streptomyces sp. DSM 44915]MDT0270118.1 hypothetical protein [Streptomyces sp. DSM 44915]
MEHEVYLPYAPAVVLSAFTEPRRVARCVPGLQPAQPGTPADRDAGPDELRGRLRLRVGSATITYRGALTIEGPAAGSGSADAGCVVRAEGGEARGDGEVSLLLTIRPRPVDGGAGCVLAIEGRLTGSGRIAELDHEQRESAGRRLLDRFAAALADELSGEAEPPPVAGGIGEPDDNERAIPGIPAAPGPGPDAGPPPPPPAAPAQPAAEADGGGLAAGPAGAAGATGASGASGVGPAGRSAEPEPVGERPREGAVEPAASEPAAEPAAGGRPGEAVPPALDPDRAEPAGTLPAPEADHARRTMIGRSAEEVDHAPPRGRYAPEPAPGGGARSGALLRWAAPAAALAIASAVAIHRALRHRR